MGLTLLKCMQGTLQTGEIDKNFAISYVNFKKDIRLQTLDQD